jgi:hypothetical protein
MMMEELLPFAVVVVFFGLIGFLVRHMIRLKRNIGERRVQLEAEAEAYSYRPAPEDTEELIEGLRTSPRFQNRTIHIRHLLTKRSADATRYLAQYSVTGSRSSTDNRGLMFVSRLNADRLPPFVLHPSTIKLPKLIKAGIDKAIQLRYPGFDPVPMAGAHPDLEHCLMYAESPDSGIRVLDGDVIGALLSAQGWAIESTGGWLLAEKDKRGSLPATKVEDIMAELLEFENIAPAFEN